MAPRGWRVRGLAWRLSQPAFDPVYGKLICLATGENKTERTKQICLWMTIEIYVCMYVYISMNTSNPEFLTVFLDY